MMVESAELCLPPINTSCTSMPFSPEAALIWMLLSSISLLTVILNLFVILSISHFRQLKTPTNVILLSLAVSDLLTGLAVMPAAILTLQSCRHMNSIVCAFSSLLSFVVISASVGNMVLISVDRYVAICNPLRYSSIVTTSRVQICVSLCWICSIFYSVIILKDDLSRIDLSNLCSRECGVVLDYISGAVDLFFTFLGPVSVITVLYTRVFVVAVSQARATRTQVSTVTSSTVIVKKSEIRAARNLGVTVLVFIICLCPYYAPAISGQETTADVSLLAQIWLLYCNSTFNPLIYAFFYPWFRKAVKLIVSFQIMQAGSREAKIL